MRKLFLMLLVGAFVVSVPLSAFALSLPANEDLELDIIDYTSLYRDFVDVTGPEGKSDGLDDNFLVPDTDGDGKIALPSGATPVFGDESRAFLKIKDIVTVSPDWGGTQDQQVWAYNVPYYGGEGIIAIEKELIISQIFITPGSDVNIFFTGTTDNPNGIFEAYLADPALDFTALIALGDPQDWGGLEGTVSLDTLLWKGTFTQSTYVDDFNGDGTVDTVNALVGIHLDSALATGRWIANNETPVSPAGFTINPEAWLNLDPAYSYPWVEDFWGTGKDLAVANVGLDSAESFSWTSKSDDWIRGHTVPEPATMLLLGTGLITMALAGRKKRKK